MLVCKTKTKKKLHLVGRIQKWPVENFKINITQYKQPLGLSNSMVYAERCCLLIVSVSFLTYSRLWHETEEL